MFRSGGKATPAMKNHPPLDGLQTDKNHQLKRSEAIPWPILGWSNFPAAGDHALRITVSMAALPKGMCLTVRQSAIKYCAVRCQEIDAGSNTAPSQNRSLPIVTSAGDASSCQSPECVPSDFMSTNGTPIPIGRDAIL